MTNHLEADMRRVGQLFATCLRAVDTMQPSNRVAPPHWREGYDTAKQTATGRISLLMAETLKQMETVAKEMQCQTQPLLQQQQPQSQPHQPMLAEKP